MATKYFFSKYTIICLGKNLEPKYFFFQFSCQNVFTQKFSILIFFGGKITATYLVKWTVQKFLHKESKS